MGGPLFIHGRNLLVVGRDLNRGSNGIDHQGAAILIGVEGARGFHFSVRRTLAFKRITINGDQMGGMPCIRGLRMPVATVVGLVAAGLPPAEIVLEHPELEEEDVREALRCAAEALRERQLPYIA